MLMVPDWESLPSSVDKQLWALTVCQTWGGQDGHFLWVLSFRTASLVSLGRRKQSILMALEKLSCPDQSSPDLLLNCRKEHKACRKSFFFFPDKACLSKSIVLLLQNPKSHIWVSETEYGVSSIDIPTRKILSPSVCPGTSESCVSV